MVENKKLVVRDYPVQSTANLVKVNNPEN